MHSSLLIHTFNINRTGRESGHRRLLQPSNGHAKGLAAMMMTI